MGVPATVLAIPYLYAASICAQLAGGGGPGWLYLLVMLLDWNALKVAFVGPISLVLLIRVCLREVLRSRRAVDVGAAQ